MPTQWKLSKKKWLLWLILVVQLCFISCFWIIQAGLQAHVDRETHSLALNNNKAKTKMFLNVANGIDGLFVPTTDSRVKFVTKMKNVAKEPTEVNLTIYLTNVPSQGNVNQFEQDYLELNTYRLMNITEIEAEMLMDQSELIIDRHIWCFREGTINESVNSMLYWNVDAQRPKCKCRQYWHGNDCGQPEVIWRALMLPGNHFKLREPDKEKPPHRLIYMLEGNFHSLNFDFLELQIKSVDDVIDHFLIYWSSKHVEKSTLKKLQRKLNKLIHPNRYILYYCSQKNVNNISETCNTVEAFRYFNEKLELKSKSKIKTTDLFLYSNESIVYPREPLKFLKYYAAMDKFLWQFRLKYNVYGFYWQHPSRTHLSGFISSFGYVEDSIKLHNLIYKVQSGVNIIGDLNHYGGWYCQYCQHPDEIIKELHELPVDSSSHNKFELPNSTRNRFIDTKYLEYLITHGIHIDGKTQLNKIRQYNDKFFAPSYAQKFKWKYSNILTNFFAAMENDYVVEESEGGAGF